VADYKGAGVDLDTHSALVRRIAELAGAASRPEVLTGVGLFAGAIALPSGMSDPVLVASADGVGTKVLLAAACARYRAVGVDVVVHCANDVSTSGASPLFFLDYLAVHRLDPAVVREIVAGVAEACRACGCALLGGETAQMPDLYRENTYDLAGTMVGVVERARLVRPHPVAGDRVVGIPSSGPHTNGYSLIRKILADTGTDPRAHADLLLAPSRLYSRDVARLLASGSEIRAMAHITGGGLPGNLDRALAPGVDAVLDPSAWHRPAVFRWLQDLGGVPEAEMRRVFNLGIGFCLIVPAGDADALCREIGDARVIGEIVAGSGQVRFL
jgi:phosphoribosylformylglycinamidine cyclo-ligase